jgi:hypothetical protein
VSVYYPDDHADFALRADEKFFERHHLVAELLGANIPLPELTRRLEAERGRVIHVGDVDEEPSVGDESVSAWDDSPTGLDTIASRLRELLGPNCRDREFDETAQQVLLRMINRLYRGAVSTYPPIIQHALTEMRRVLEGYEKKAKAADRERNGVLTAILDVLKAKTEQGTTNLRAVAEWWLDVVQPYRLETLKARRKRKPLPLSDLRKPLRDKPAETEVMQGLFERDLEVKPLEQRIVATIIGVSGADVPAG